MRYTITNNRSMSQFLHKHLLNIVVVMVALTACFQHTQAFTADTYASQSVLAQGRWVKVRVESSGLYMLSNNTLRSMGFTDPSRVRVYGYGGRRIDDIMSVSSYIDDLPVAPQQLTDRGVVFYAAGPDKWERSGTTTYYHAERSPYTFYGYYFVTDNEADESESNGIIRTSGTDVDWNATAVDIVQARIQHEQELTIATEAGPLTVGEDFRYTPTRQFTFSMPGRDPGSPVWLECQFVSRHVGATSQLSFMADGEKLSSMSTDRIEATSSSQYVHASIGLTRRTFTPTGSNPESMTITVNHTSTGVIQQANLDYLAVNYRRKLTLPAEGYMEFWANERQLELSGAGADLILWDVTTPTATEAVRFESRDGVVRFRPSYTAMRSYVAWRPGANIPEPKIDGIVSNQNLHDSAAEPVDMVIIGPAQLLAQGRRIAALHETNDSMRVAVIDAAQIYNEFASGAPDVSAVRKYLKMLYDRGIETDRPLKYVLLLGRATLDHRGVTAYTRNLGYTTVPLWVNITARQSMNDNDGYGTDDFVAMLKDGSGRDHGLDDLCVAVGRIPMTSDADGASIVDKMYQYANSSKNTHWKNRVLVLADDEDQGVHLRQAESMIKNYLATKGQQHVVDKVYLDAYTKSSGNYPVARTEMFQALDEGVAWWVFTGHANDHSWTGDGQLTYTDLNNLYLRNVPFVIASTCDFLRWDTENESGGEIMYKERYGGSIGMISATRPVYISDNGYFLEALGKAMLSRDKEGRYLTPGEVYRVTKNTILDSRGEHKSNTNRLRFVFMGDPALRLVTPDNIVELTTINGKEVIAEEQITIAAMGSPVISGRVTDPDGNLLSGFNGTVYIDIYDALTSVTTNGNGNGRVEVFDRHGDKLYAGSAKVTAGEFTLTVAMPQMVADNFRPALMSMYAVENGNNPAQAVGVNRDFYVYGFEEPAEPDVVAPSIDFLYLNHSGFASGDRVNSAPMVIAGVSDNVGINLSTAGVGQRMTLTLDGMNTYSDVSAFYTPSADGSPSGVINYALENLSEGAHTLRLRVFDTSGNVAQREIDLFVDDNMAPQIFEVFSDANPASTSANFYVRHDRPENIVEVSVTVYDLLGHPVWTGSSKGMSDNDLSSPVTWDLTDMAGRRVVRGIYLYRATISTDNAHYETSSQRIAVTAN